MKKFSYKIVWLIIVLCIILAIPIISSSYESFQSSLVGRSIPSNLGFMAAIPPTKSSKYSYY